MNSPLSLSLSLSLSLALSLLLPVTVVVVGNGIGRGLSILPLIGSVREDVYRCSIPLLPDIIVHWWKEEGMAGG